MVKKIRNDSIFKKPEIANKLPKKNLKKILNQKKKL